MSVAVVVPTFGDRETWEPLAQRAVASAEAQTVVPEIIRYHGETLQEARNGGAAKSSADFLIFLDADDELDPYYVEAMLAGTPGDICRPSLLGVTDGVADNEPVLLAERDLRQANYIPIGAMLNHELFDTVGGFADLPILEDWHLFLRLWRLGASIVAVPDAVYKVNVRLDSRNQDRDLHHRIYNQIRNESCV